MCLNISLLFLCVGTAQGANILGVFMVPSISHQNVYQVIWRELSLRGHNVTVVTPNPLKDPSLSNLTEISVDFAYDILKRNGLQNIMSKDANVFLKIHVLFQMLEAIAAGELDSTQVQELISDKTRQFDLILIQGLYPVMYAFAARFKAPIITLASLELFVTDHDLVGNPTHPALYPDLLSISFPKEALYFCEKMKSVLFSLWVHFYHNIFLLPRSETLAKRYFKDEVFYIPYLMQSASFIPSINPFIHPLRPNVPLVKEMGQTQIRPAKALPSDLETILDQSEDGVIYFSLGSNVKSVGLNENLRKTIAEALSELPYTVLWKWEFNHLPGQPTNVIVRKWFPQQDVLAHPNVRAFITQGGLQSIEEAISRGVPLIGMPFMSDQPANVKKIADLGIGVGVDPDILTKSELKRCIIEVAENSKYKAKIKMVKEILYDRPMTGLERAIWWSEYVIRHNGTAHLKSPAASTSWFHFLLLDVAAVVILVTVAFVLMVTNCLKLFHG